MKKNLFLLAFVVAGSVQANISPAGFEAFPNDYFVEKGTFSGQGIQYALRAGFPEIHSIELFKRNVDNVSRMFESNGSVHVHLGDSGKVLYEVIKDINKEITFWLDAHSGENDPTKKNSPLLEELDQIKKHHIKTHTILIDDMHCAGKAFFDFVTQDQIKAKIKEINPAYEITYVPGGDDAEYPENVMVARVPQS